MAAARRTHGAPGAGKRKSEVVTIRLDPKLKYIAELAARKQRRTLSSYIEWAVEQSLSNLQASEYTPPGYPIPRSFADVAATAWDVDEADRFVKLAQNFPELLTHDEQRVWKLICECGGFWRGWFEGPKWRWHCIEGGGAGVLFPEVRKHWRTLHQVARGEEPVSALPLRPSTVRPPVDEYDDGDISY
jgi:hypothetical protein